jgi:uncharacterized membrane protein (UPF0127 family)
MRRRVRRREVLAGATALAAALAGCASGAPDDGATEPTRTATEPADATDTVGRSPSPTGTRTKTTTDAGGYERATVTAVNAGGTELATVDVRIADTPDKRYLGLSDTDSLGPDEGMLFTYEREDRYAYVMRNMSFPLDIVFLRADGTVSRIVHADVAGTGAPYRGEAKYVLEVNRGWANRTGVAVGDRIEIPAAVRGGENATRATPVGS